MFSNQILIDKTFLVPSIQFTGMLLLDAVNCNAKTCYMTINIRCINRTTQAFY